MLHYSYVQANCFETLGIPLFLGRRFGSEGGQPEKSVILSESAANQLWPGRTPLAGAFAGAPRMSGSTPGVSFVPMGRSIE